MQNLNLAQLLRIPFQALVAELHERLAQAGYADIRAPHTIVFAHIDAEGMRLTEFARRAQLTKQMVSYLVAGVEELGYVELAPDPTDKRAKIVRLTPRGVKASRCGRDIIAGIERDWAGMLGKDAMCDLRAVLERLVGSMERTEDGGRM